MKRLFFPVIVAAALSGCAVVSPYEQPYDVHSSAPAYGQPYAVSPGYATPAPVYRPPIYVGPPIRFSFGLNYWRGHRHHFGHHHHRFGHRGFGRGGWRH